MGVEPKNNQINEILKEAHNEIEPPDSWEALSSRINQRIDNRANIPDETWAGIVFWKRLAAGMAACFLVTTGVLLYQLGFSDGLKQSQHEMADVAGLLSQADLNRLSLTFSQVRQLFGQQSHWIMIGSDNSTQMGVDDAILPSDSKSRIIVVRLAASLEGSGTQRQYFDIVTVADRKAELRLPIAGVPPVKISLRPTVMGNGTIAVEINMHNAKVDKTLGHKFTSLVRTRTNGNWLNIDGTGRMLKEI
jgi:hypothetical protein